MPSLARLRPDYFASAYAFWGVETREAALRYVPSSNLQRSSYANVELKPSDASVNPYLALAALIAAGLAGVEERLGLPAPVAQDPGGWTEDERERAGSSRCPSTRNRRSRRCSAASASGSRSASRSSARFSPFAARRDHRRPPLALLGETDTTSSPDRGRVYLLDELRRLLGRALRLGVDLRPDGRRDRTMQ